MESLGHTIEEAQPSGDWDELSHAMWVLVAANVSLSLKRRASEAGRPVSAEDVDRVTWSAVELHQLSTLRPIRPPRRACIDRAGEWPSFTGPTIWW